MESLQEFITGLPLWLQWLGVIAVSALPFVESYFGSVLGVLAGITPVVAIAAAIIGNVVSMVAVVTGAHAVRRRLVGEPSAPLSPRRQRLRRMFDRYGIAGVSLLGQTVLPSQITAGMMVSFGAAKEKVIAWQVVSIIVWGVLFGVLAVAGVDLVAAG
ncbi:hypothetical protein [Ornithinicoccus halotolerans]|uniref:hypothetical protein n=1 Tax=Ornithinicoccus halotolerans TaxID=1748220 RepID=UPI001297EA2E|nr:hypothetical protein [Ornithinicoccus halotolerans]